MVLFNLLLFIALRDVLYLRYVAFSSTMAFTLAGLAVVPANALSMNALPFASALEMLLLALGQRQGTTGGNAAAAASGWQLTRHDWVLRAPDGRPLR